MTALRYVLGSRSPRRRELLSLLVPSEQIEVVPPPSPDEPGFEGLTDWPAIRAQLLSIAHHKAEQVRRKLGDRADGAIIITADTTIVCGENVVDAGDTTDPAQLFVPPLVVLGQPPETPDWPATVRGWFERWYAGRTHVAATAVCVMTTNDEVRERVVTSAITMRADIDPWLEWYLGTGEPRGKAGGYALQGAGSVFVTKLVGSSSNVVGLPMESVRELLTQATANSPD